MKEKINNKIEILSNLEFDNKNFKLNNTSKELNKKVLLNFNRTIFNYPHNNILPNIKKFTIIEYNFRLLKQNINNNLKFKYYKSLEYLLKILYSFFSSLNCILSKPIFINKPDKLIIRAYYYQSNNKNSNFLITNKDSNLAYKLINNKKFINNNLNLNSNKQTNNNIIKKTV